MGARDELDGKAMQTAHPGASKCWLCSQKVEDLEALGAQAGPVRGCLAMHALIGDDTFRWKSGGVY